MLGENHIIYSLTDRSLLRGPAHRWRQRARMAPRLWCCQTILQKLRLRCHNTELFRVRDRQRRSMKVIPRVPKRGGYFETQNAILLLVYKTNFLSVISTAKWPPEVGYNPAVGWCKESTISKIYITPQREHS